MTSEAVKEMWLSCSTQYRDYDTTMMLYLAWTLSPSTGRQIGKAFKYNVVNLYSSITVWNLIIWVVHVCHTAYNLLVEGLILSQHKDQAKHRKLAMWLF